MFAVPSLGIRCGRWLAILVATLSIFSIQPAVAAYVQFKDCYDTLPLDEISSQLRLRPESVRAELSQQGDAALINLRLWGRFPGEDACDSIAQLAPSSQLIVTSVTGTTTYNTGPANATCSQVSYGPLIDYRIGHSVNYMHSVETFQLMIRLQGTDGKPFACVKAPLTPDIGPSVTAIAFWGPVAVLALVVMAAGLRSLVLPSSSLADDQTGPFFREASRQHLTQIADCLSYIQFIFFSGTLSLSYPVFFQPVVSHSSWSTLMASAGPVSHHSLYHGIKDGIYEVNGTFGGTYGMELMTQVIGAPVTRATWNNVMAYTSIIFLLLIVVILAGKRLNRSRHWFFVPPTRETRAQEELSGIKHTMWTAFRALISYFLLPVVAWTTYQLDHAQILPYYHTIICAVVLLVLFASFWWGATQLSPRHLGYLILNSSQDYQTLTTMSRSQDMLSIAMFGFVFVRGAAIGGLQIAGLPQLAVLLGCESLQIALIILTRTPTALLSISGLCVIARVLVTLFSVLFLPDVAAFETISIFGYIILAVHALVLIFVFLCPSTYQIVRLAARALSGSDSDAEGLQSQFYNLRKLRQRPNTSNNLALPTLPNLSRSRDFSPFAPSPNPSSPESSVSEDTARYYRRPRSRLSSPNLLQPQIFEASENSASDSQREDDCSLSSGETHSAADLVHHGEAVRWADSVRFSSPGVDYSVRESDMYYGRARQGDVEQTLEAEPSSSSSTSSISRKVSDLWKGWTVRPVKAEKETGFVVIRPPRVVVDGVEPAGGNQSHL